jgi:hypothetical protein
MNLSATITPDLANIPSQTRGRRALALSPHEISVKGTLQTLNQFLPLLSDAVSLDHWYDSLLQAISTHTVANRPNRIEPRCRKRRPKKFKNLREHRSNYKNRLRSRR